MPAFDPNLVLDPDLSVRAAMAYEAALRYAEGRLSAGDHAAFLALLAGAGLPTDSDDVLTHPQATQLASAVRHVALWFVTAGGRHINPDPIAGLPQSLAGIVVRGILTVAGDLTVGAASVDDDLLVSGAATVGSLIVTGDADVTGDVAVDGGLDVGSPPAPAPDGSVAAEGRVSGSLLVATSQVPDFAAAELGTLGEDAAGDVAYRALDGRVVYLTRPTHDTGWLTTNPAHAALGIAGTSAPDPSQTPDVYGGTPLVLLNPEPGAQGGPARAIVWVRADTSLVDGGAPTGAFYYFRAGPFQTGGGALGGVHVYVDSVTGRLAILLGDPLVAAQTAISYNEATVPPDVRVMLWVR